jgi:hypothetical protein
LFLTPEFVFRSCHHETLYREERANGKKVSRNFCRFSKPLAKRVKNGDFHFEAAEIAAWITDDPMAKYPALKAPMLTKCASEHP